jgi:hypothetical protein
MLTISSYQFKKIFAQEDPSSFEICDNFVDDDGDGYTDAEDPEGCSPAPILDNQGLISDQQLTNGHLMINS